jgi:hypothetical protein
MKRRAKLSLRRNSQKLKKPNITEYTAETQSHGHLNKATQSLSTSLSSSSSFQGTAGDGDTGAETITGPEPALLDHSNVSGSAILDEVFDHDCDVGSQDYPMSCESPSVCDVSPGSGHQMESEGDVEECGDTDDAIPSSSVSCNSKLESNSEEIDCVVDPTPEIDLCTQYCDDCSNPALYSLSSDDIAHFDDFSVPERTQSNPSMKRQTSLLSFMTRSRTSRSNSESVLFPSTSSDCQQQTAAGTSLLANAAMAIGKRKATNRVNDQADIDSQASGSSQGNGSGGRTKRTCPFYKRIPGRSRHTDTMT